MLPTVGPALLAYIRHIAQPSDAPMCRCTEGAWPCRLPRMPVCSYAAEGAAGAEQSAPFQPQLNFSSYSRAPPPAAVADKPEQPDDQKLLDAEAPPSSKGRRYAPHTSCVISLSLSRLPVATQQISSCSHASRTALMHSTLSYCWHPACMCMVRAAPLLCIACADVCCSCTDRLSRSQSCCL